MNKKTVAVLFGGQSSEHSVSLVSATTIISNMDSEKYFIIPVGITKEGKWLIYNGPVENIKNGDWEKYGTPAVLSPDAGMKGIIKIVGDKAKIIPVDVVFPVLHGAWGEDGTIQGLLELAKIPYVGCGVLASSVSMDKVYTKIICKDAGIPQANYTWVFASDIEKEDTLKRIEKEIGYPLFIKPSNAGSSVGISKATNRDELLKGLKEAARYDRKIVIEEFVNGRELECAVLGNEDIKVTRVGEILSAADAEFYDFDAKYNNPDSKTVIPAPIPAEKEEEIRSLAKKVFKAVDGSGISRIDFFMDRESEKIIFNELNTLPGFTSISMYPMLWEEAGLPKKELIDELIELALSRDNGIRG
ncbi:D-alanine--D-alanine ligase A [Tyzzerella sp. An114]|uniref:D-alanine--D-alanine ligase family protein n=1 Tax=Tyzzerella sp. An114 TaxID=1965545 RepID=UPI000B4369DA|nr:D-alanine--D-alanine ligase family protein [Tyzzerella sp. An114]OUQ57931.1 D-alanine--D-alanine ligase A [Tyzzerella sp. An114]HIT72306.1 D-alanine--D-alanine ligase [Candidatus Fimicola cottocaccae]